MWKSSKHLVDDIQKIESHDVSKMFVYAVLDYKYFFLEESSNSRPDYRIR